MGQLERLRVRDAWEPRKPIEHINGRLRKVDFRVIPSLDIEPPPRKLFAE